MTYEQLHEALKQVQLDIAGKESEYKSSERQILEIRNKEDSLADEMLNKINQAKIAELKSKEDVIAKPYKDKLSKLQDKKNKLKNMYDSRVKEINFDEYSSRYSEELDIITNAKGSIGDIEATATGHLGDRLCKALFNRLDNSTVELSVEDLEELTKRLSKFQTNIGMVSKRGNVNYTELVDNLLKKLNPCKDENQEGALQNDVFMYIGACAIVSFVTVNFLSPYLILGLCTLGGLNLYKTYAIYRLVLESKLLTDNVDKIKSMVEESVNEDMEEARAELDTVYNSKAGDLDSKIQKLDDELAKKILDVRDSYKFDDTQIKKQYDLVRQGNKEEQNRMKNNITTINLAIGKLKKKASDIQREIDKATEGIADHYLSCSRYGTDFILDTKFLIDVVDNTPIFWDFPSSSCLFIYDNLKEVDDFIKILNVQLINRLNPITLSINYWDIRNFGMDLQCFNGLNDSEFNICGDSEKVEEALKDLSEEFKQRGPIIRKEHNNIVEYNKFMLELESVPKSYNFIMSLSVNPRLYDDERLQRLIRKGAEVGIYTLFFLTLDELKEMKKVAETLIQNCDKVYSISGGRVNKKAKSFYQRVLDAEKR